jgi:hypothetical protein
MSSTSSPTFTTPRSTRPVFHRHQKRLVDVSHRVRDLRVERRHQLVDRLLPLRVSVERRQRRSSDHRRRVPIELVLVQELAHFHLDQVQHLRVVHRVALVQKHHDVVQTHLPRQKHVLPRLRHHAVQRAHHQDRAIHLRRSRDHVLDVVRVPGAIDVRVVTLVTLVLHVRHRDRHRLGLVSDRPALRDVLVADHLRQTLFRLDLHDRRRQRRLAVIDVSDRSHVHVRLGALEFLFRHD